jgi:iron complex transport system permease protein
VPLSKAAIFLVINLLLLLFGAVGSLLLGSLQPEGVAGFIHALLHPLESTLGYAIWEIRLPRLLSALLGGAALALAGALMQTVLQNPLASPFTLGISQGAAFGASFAIIFLGSGVVIASRLDVAVFAFLGALAGTALILLLAAVRGMRPEGLILSGVAFAALFNALIMTMQYFATDFQLSATVFWTFGDLGKGGFEEAGILAAILLLTLLYALKNRWSYNALSWGELHARGLGVAVGSLRAITLILAALPVAVATAFFGVIGFVGLVAPHMVRLFCGGNHTALIPLSMLAGANLLILADLTARWLFLPIVLPVGILTAFLGVPMFLYLIIRRARRATV